jgi:hypothetical protein
MLALLPAGHTCSTSTPALLPASLTYSASTLAAPTTGAPPGPPIHHQALSRFRHGEQLEVEDLSLLISETIP